MSTPFVLVEELLLPIRYLRLIDAARIYSVSDQQLRNLIDGGRLTAYRMTKTGGVIRVSVAEMEALFGSPIKPVEKEQDL